MEIRELHHVSVPVSELERSKQFYREVLGLAELPRPPFPFPGAGFRLGDRELHLIGDSSPETGAAAGVDARRLHFAIRVASFQAALAWLEERGFRENAPAGDPSRLVVTVEEAFFHCSKCVVRSNLWDAEGWTDASDLAPLGTVMRDQLKLDVPAEAIQAGLDKDVEKRLY